MHNRSGDRLITFEPPTAWTDNVTDGGPIGRRRMLLKELEDKILGIILILLLLPLMIIIAVSIRLDSPGPIIFRQRRDGHNNVGFEILKFRTMVIEPDQAGEDFQQTLRDDPRVTRVGRFLRQSSLDELPQILNVLRGQMSLVGPRPHPTGMRTEGRLGHELISDYGRRHHMKPGMTGWAQINGLRGATQTVEQLRRRVEFDIFYVERWSIFFDIKILILTPIRMIMHHDTAF